MTISGEVGALNDAWKRLGWAHEHHLELFDAITEFQGKAPYMFRIDRHGTHAEAVFIRHVDPDEEARANIHFARLFGVFLDNCRAALNYAAYQLALLANQRNGDSGPNPEVVEFPIYASRADLTGRNWFNKFPDDMQAALEAWQPYRGHEGLWLLHQLGRKYRHRLIHPLAVVAFAEQSEVLVDGRPVEVEVLCSDAPLRDNDPVLRFPLQGNPDAVLGPTIPIGVGIDDDTCRGRLATSVANLVMSDTADAMRALLFEFFI